MKLQDQRLLWDIKAHPSVTLFALEGDTNPRWSIKSLWTQYLQQNIHNIPVFGLDLPVRLLKMELRQDEITSECLPDNCKGAWLVETVIQSQFLLKSLPKYVTQRKKELSAASFQPEKKD